MSVLPEAEGGSKYNQRHWYTTLNHRRSDSRTSLAVPPQESQLTVPFPRIGGEWDRVSWPTCENSTTRAVGRVVGGGYIGRNPVSRNAPPGERGDTPWVLCTGHREPIDPVA